MSKVPNSIPVPWTAATTLRLNPHRGSSLVPFMNNITGDDDTRDLMRAAVAFFPAAAAPSSAPFSSPPAAISRMMSHPPRSSPPAYNCGYVGQLLYSLSPCRTSSSLRMSKVSNAIPVSVTAATTLRLNPHRGSSLVPLMKSTTGACVVSCFSRVSMSTTGAAGAAGAAAAGGMTVATPKCCCTLLASALASAPSSVSTSSALWCRVKEGTALIS
mmetsp:Transcript_34131/g.85907  ORF Transcript_34131/g.85907 Transcript_34131/m.85907 type:complete len:215 (+) Transcript_34131:92-736(+)